MAADATHPPIPQTLDASGLPAPVVQEIKRLIETRRVSLELGEPVSVPSPPRPLRGIFAEHGSCVPREQIDEAQRETWASFPRDFPEPPQDQ